MGTVNKPAASKAGDYVNIVCNCGIFLQYLVK